MRWHALLVDQFKKQAAMHTVWPGMVKETGRVHACLRAGGSPCTQRQQVCVGAGPERAGGVPGP